MLTLYKKELNYYLNNPVGYFTVILFAVFANFLFIKDIFLAGSASLRPFFGILPWLLMVFIPAITMRVFAEEKRLNTIELLLTLPVSETQIVLSKFCAVMTLIIISFLLTLATPIALSFLTLLYLPEIIVGYLGALLLAGFLTSISMFLSFRTNNQIVAFLSSVIVIFFLLVLSTDFTASVLPKFIQDSINYFTPMYHYQGFIKGVLDFRSFVYMVSGFALFLFLTVIGIEKRS